jgi:phage baseplate assembly protein W
MPANGLNVDDRPFRAEMMEHVRTSLKRMEARGQVRKIVVEPEVWRELA